jgi:D-alanine transaminase
MASYDWNGNWQIGTAGLRCFVQLRKLAQLRGRVVTRIAYVNGLYLSHRSAAVHIEDRGFQFADSVYEVCSFHDGVFIDEQAHLERLERSLSLIDIEMPMSNAGLRIVFRELVRKNRIHSGIIYCQVTRGQAKRDHGFPDPATTPTLVVTAKRVAPGFLDERRRNGVGVVFRPDTRWAQCHIKSTGLLPNVLAKQSARVAGADEAWFVDEEGNVTEGTSTNAWIVTGQGTLVTRPLDSHILGGVTRGALITCARAAGLPVEERKFSVEEAKNAAEAFSSASTIGALPIVSLDGIIISDGAPGPITSRLNALYAESAKIGA